ncbi:MAG: hypothetical protein L6Q26_04245 [Anaerolineales bacterium]|nr:hypothetical protein [Anaerolineales bacterium]NUQ83398.1 hypothetical protein [Anaerolineales bacterium]
MNSQAIIIIAVAVFMGWFAIGMIYNLRRGDKLLKWMQDGLPLIGQRTTFRWLGSSVAEMGIAKAKRPFHRMDVLIVLKPRDVFWMTLIALFQRRSDILIFRAALGTPPLLDLELADPKTWSGREALAKATKRGWEGTDYHGLRLMAPKGLINLAASTVDQLAAPMQAFSPRFVRLGLRKTSPNMEVHLPFPNPNETDAKTYFQSLCNLGRAIGERN